MSLWNRDNTPPSELKENMSNMDNRINNILAEDDSEGKNQQLN